MAKTFDPDPTRAARESCPNRDAHTECPDEGFVNAACWHDEMQEDHVLHTCTACGLGLIYVPVPRAEPNPGDAA